MDEFKHMRSAMAAAIKTLAAKYAIAPKTESPIETIFGAAVSLLMEEALGDDFKVGKTGLEANFTLVPQYKLGGYRYDFAVCVAGEALVLIECDGKDFHSSPEQIANDANKDNFATFSGKKILRFSGSVINSHADLCAREVVSALIFEGKRRGLA
jgi:very-short-patch-repair endonuclease